MINKRLIGDWGEDIALEFLKNKVLRLLKRILAVRLGNRYYS